MIKNVKNESKAVRDTAPTIVKKITFNNEEELQEAIQAEIDAQRVNHHVVYKISQLMPINETTVYLVLTPDLDKVIVSFLDISSGETENSLTDGMVAIMTYSEIEFMMNKPDVLNIGDGMYEIDYVNYDMFTSTWRSIDVFVVDAIEAMEE